MAFLAPLIPLALGAIGITGTAASIASVAIGVGLSFAAKKLQAKKARGSSASGASVNLRIDPAAPRQTILGEVATGGSLVYWQLSGTDNKTLHMVIALADHECNAMTGLLIDSKAVEWNSGTGIVTGYNSKLKVRFYSGAAGQTADNAVVAASGGRWTANEKGEGVCYAVVEMDYDEALFPQGIPEFRFVVQGAKLFDPRTSVTAYSDNVAVALYNVLRGIKQAGTTPVLGMNVPADAIRLSDAQAAANVCDELVAKKAGGTEKRYRCGVVFDSTQTNRDVIETLIAAMAGEIIESGGIYRIMAGAAQTPVATLTDADLIVTEPYTVKPKRPRSELVNGVLGSFADPSRAYNMVPLPPRFSSEDETADGNIRLTQTLDLVAVTSRSQAQRCQEIERRRARRQILATMTARARWFVLEPGDWVAVTSDRRGFTTKTFQVDGRESPDNLTTALVLGETDAEIDDWSTDLEIDDNQVIDLLSAGPSLSSVSGIDLDAVTIPGAGDEQRPGLQINWTPITDPTVVSLKLEYRIVGDTIAIERNILNPGAGTYTWMDGVQGGVTYEARLKPVTQPERGTVWSSWVSSASEAPPQIVSLAAEALYIDPSNIPPAELDAQSKLELARVTAAEAIQGSLAAQLLELRQAIEQTAQAAMGSIAEHDIEIRQVRGSADGNTVTVTEVLAVVDGVQGRFGVSIDVNGRIVGAIQLDGTNESSNFTVLADNFAVGSPGKPDRLPFVVNDDGIFLDGVVVQDGSLSADKINAATLYTLYITDPNNNYYYNFATGRQGTTDGLFLIDSQQGEIRITSPQPLDYRYAVNSGFVVPVLF